MPRMAVMPRKRTSRTNEVTTCRSDPTCPLSTVKQSSLPVLTPLQARRSDMIGPRRRGTAKFTALSSKLMIGLAGAPLVVLLELVRKGSKPDAENSLLRGFRSREPGRP